MKPFKKILALLASILFISALAACGSAHQTTSPEAQPVALAQASTSLVGKWHQTNEGVPGAVESAVITADKITITLKLGDSSGVFWAGTFDPNAPATDSYSIVSKGDQSVLSESFYASSETTKTFTYHNGVISYEFSIMGVSATIHLSK